MEKIMNPAHNISYKFGGSGFNCASFLPIPSTRDWQEIARNPPLRITYNIGRKLRDATRKLLDSDLVKNITKY